MFKASNLIAKSLVQSILQKTQAEISKKQFIKANMNCYCSNRMISMVNELGDQLLSNPQDECLLKSQNEPEKPLGDTLMTMTNIQPSEYQMNKNTQKLKSISENKSAQASYRNNKKKQSAKADSLNSVVGKGQKSAEQTNNQLHKLNINNDEDKQITEKRKQKQKQFLVEKKKGESKMLQQKYSKLSKDGVNFDYDGKIFQLKQQKRNNLISKFVTSTLPIQSQKLKKQTETLNEKVTRVQTHQVEEKEQKKYKSMKKKQAANNGTERKQQYKQYKPEIHFSRIKSPIQNMDVKLGVKATFNKDTLQKKQKKISDEELKKNRSNRKLSKKQYNRIKTNQIHVKLETHAEEPNIQEDNSKRNEIKMIVHQSKEHRPLSSMKKRSITEIQSKVHVEDQDLKTLLLQRNRQMEEKQQPRKVLDDRPSTEARKRQTLNKIDKYNLEYSRNKKQYEGIKKLGDQQSVLPKIPLKHQLNLPKAREKVRGSSAMRREATKRFQEILRV